MAREPLLMAAVGKKGVGKSYQTTMMMNEYVLGDPANGVPPRRCLIMDINDEYVQYQPISLNDVALFSVHPIVEIRRIRPFNLSTGQRMGYDEWTQALFHVLRNYYNGFLLIEDVSRFIGDYLPDDLIGAICTNRHVGLDICLHYQAIGRLTPKIWQNVNVIRYHMNQEKVDRHENKIPDKFEFLKIAENMVIDQYRNGNERFFVYVDLDREKIFGKFSKDVFLRAVDEYVSVNHTKLVKPLINQIDDKGKKKHTTTTAINEVKKRLIETYL